MAPIISPVVFIYSVFGESCPHARRWTRQADLALSVYAVIFTGLFVSVIGLSIVSITPIRFKAFIASLITDEYTKLSPVNWNSGGMFRARHKVIVDNAQLILGSREQFIFHCLDGCTANSRSRSGSPCRCRSCGDDERRRNRAGPHPAGEDYIWTGREHSREGISCLLRIVESAADSGA